MLEAVVGFVNDLVDSKGADFRSGCFASCSASSLVIRFQPFLENRAGPRVQRGNEPMIPRLALLYDKVRVRNDESGDAITGDTQTTSERCGNGHEIFLSGSMKWVRPRPAWAFGATACAARKHARHLQMQRLQF